MNTNGSLLFKEEVLQMAGCAGVFLNFKHATVEWDRIVP